MILLIIGGLKMTNIITLKDIVAKSKYGENFWRQGLCRSEFEKHRVMSGQGKYIYNDSLEFREELKNYLRLKRKI